MNESGTPAVPPQFAAAVTTEVFRQLGQIARRLHDSLEELGMMSRLQRAATGLPDARSRLDYVARKTAEAAEKVLNSVDQAKSEHERITHATRRAAQAMLADPVATTAGSSVMEFVREVESAAGRVDRHLTDIMIAQDFHDLTGQVVSKVVVLATELEDSLVQLLLQVAPTEPACDEAAALQGPVVDPRRAQEVVANQDEVDEVLASLGF